MIEEAKRRGRKNSEKKK
uniref:Uncharacterized protein n=1 Tax=Rhizophora mucronata TaxID=61149 RepID=A0A2P2KH85_RHIMU